MITIIAIQEPIVKKITNVEPKMVTIKENKAKEEVEEAIKSILKAKWVLQTTQLPPLNKRIISLSNCNSKISNQILK